MLQLRLGLFRVGASHQSGTVDAGAAARTECACIARRQFSSIPELAAAPEQTARYEKMVHPVTISYRQRR